MLKQTNCLQNLELMYCFLCKLKMNPICTDYLVTLDKKKEDHKYDENKRATKLVFLTCKS